MECNKCGTQMQERSGRYGNFLFCPNQHTCGCKTITVSSPNKESMFKSQRIATRQRIISRESREEAKARHYWEGEFMMADIEFGELGGAGD